MGTKGRNALSLLHTSLSRHVTEVSVCPEGLSINLFSRLHNLINMSSPDEEDAQSNLPVFEPNESFRYDRPRQWNLLYSLGRVA